MSTVGAWLVPLAPYGLGGGVVGFLGPVWPPWGRGRSRRPRMAAEGRGRSPGYWMAAMGAWPVLWVPYGHRGGVASLLGSVWPPWGRARSHGPRVAAMGAWLVT